MKRTAPILALLIAVLSGAAISSAPGCAEECSFEGGEDGLPEPAFECPAAELCYRGQCFRACNAGRESIEPCGEDADCGGIRKFCSESGFCSACPNEQSCVPTLDICRPVRAPPIIDLPPRPEDNDFVPDGPLDAGLPDGSGLVRFPDAGDPSASPIPATAAVHIELSRDMQVPADFSCAAPPDAASISEPFAWVRAWVVRLDDRPAGAIWRGDLVPPATEELADEALRDGQCEVRRLEPSLTATQGNIGDVSLEDSDGSGAVKDAWLGTFDAGYRVTAVDGAADPLVFDPNPPFAESLGSLQIFGFGNGSVTNGSYGAELDLPFDFRPNCATFEALRRGLRVPAPPQADLVFGWLDPLNGATGQVVYVRIDASSFGLELVCEETEASGNSTIVVTAALLEGFSAQLAAAGALADGDAALRIEVGRRNLQRIQIDPAPGQLIFATAEVALRYVDAITFAGP